MFFHRSILIFQQLFFTKHNILILYGSASQMVTYRFPNLFHFKESENVQESHLITIHYYCKKSNIFPKPNKLPDFFFNEPKKIVKVVVFLVDHLVNLQKLTMISIQKSYGALQETRCPSSWVIVIPNISLCKGNLNQKSYFHC